MEISNKLALLTMLIVCTGAHAQAVSSESAVRQYLECAKASVASLDDSTSDAATVAIGLHAQCRPAFFDAGLNSDRQENITQNLRPSLVQYVLLYRVGKRRNSKV